MKTQNMRSPQGNKVPNQFIITDDGGRMKWIANYLRQVFCKHEWIVEEGYADKVYMRCKKCGYRTKHWEY